MEDNILTPKYPKNKKPERIRKPSNPIDGINHRLLAERSAEVAQSVETAIPDDNAAPTREEMEAKAIELGVKFDKRTSDKKLLKLIESAA